MGKKSKEKQPTKDEIIEQVKKFSKKVLEKYGRLIKCIVMMGSVVRGEFKPTSDVDVFVVLDDTLQKITPEAHEKIDDDLERIGAEISKRISIQPSYTLTEFWDYARVCHPIVYNFIKEGVPIFDTGFFMPIKRLLEMGRIPATREAIESYMEGAPKKLVRAKTVKLLMLAEDCYYAMLNTVQAVLMFMGVPPPVPSRAYEGVMEYLVKPGILEQEYAEWLREIIETRKKIEHKELQDVAGTFVDSWIEKAEKFVNKMFSLLNALEIRKREKILERTHEVMLKAVATAIKTLHKLPEETTEEDVTKKIGMPIHDAFKKEFIDTKKIGSYYLDVWKRIEDMKKLVEEKKSEKIPEKDVYEVREYVRKLIHELAKVLREKEVTKEEK
ncbi:MAG: nucleotidyltransferase domain-containing protein [Candidatus Aenigmarchaeota archaeon]|nr:nucleotidyltransferase domain-containing protein [Candidatus Aenigmarchaeota archaeon]